MKVKLLSFFMLLLSAAQAQHLKPGFDKQEYINLMRVSAQFGDSAYAAALPPPEGYRQVYRSPVVGLDNQWALWVNPQNTGIISIRGTTKSDVSWLENFYAAMVPAQGELQLGKDFSFSYNLTAYPRAAVHVGWLMGTAFLARDVVPKIDSCIRSGMTEFIILGHSQGGALAYLMTAHLHSLQRQQKLSAGVRFKTYCSAAPKPGNLYFAYAYEALTQGGWAFNVVNSADWVPETPISLQTLSDFNEVNPFVQAPVMIQKQKFPKNLALRYAYGRLNKPARKAVRHYRKYLGGFVAKAVKRHLTEFREPQYLSGMHYVRTGTTIVLLADEDYFRQFPQDREKIFRHHFHAAYVYLANKLVMEQNNLAGQQPATELGGAWKLNYLSGREDALDSLYPRQKPMLIFEEAGTRFSGSTGCNSFNGTLQTEGDAIRFPQTMAITRMMCPGEGEPAFLEALRSVNRFVVAGNTLSLLQGNEVVMRFERTETEP